MILTLVFVSVAMAEAGSCWTKDRARWMVM